METSDRELLHEVVKTLGVLASNLETNDADIASLRLVNQAMLGILVTNPNFIDLFAVAVVNVISADKAIMLNTEMSDEALEQRTAGVMQLLPMTVRERVRLLLK